MDGFAVCLLVLAAFWLLWKIWHPQPSKPQKVASAASTALQAAPSEWEQKNARRNRFAQLYKDKNWQGVVDEFDGYDFTQHYESFNDYQGMAQAWWHLGNVGKAEEYIELSLTAHDASPSVAFLNMAVLNREADNYEKSLEWVLKANPSQLRADKNWSLFYRSMRIGAECYMKLGLLDEGITFLKQSPTSARILDHDLADVFQWLGEFYEKAGAYDKALKSYQKVVTVRYDKEINRKILDLNQIVYEQDTERDAKRRKRRRLDLDDFEG